MGDGLRLVVSSPGSLIPELSLRKLDSRLADLCDAPVSLRFLGRPSVSCFPPSACEHLLHGVRSGDGGWKVGEALSPGLPEQHAGEGIVGVFS